MKKTFLILFTLLISFSALYAEETSAPKTTIPREKNVFTNPSDNEFIGKLGGGYASKPGKFGLDLSLNYIFNIDPVFVFGLEADLFWVKWKNKIGDVNKGAVNADVTANTDLYTFPFFANAQIRFPFLRSKIYMEPSLTVGLGYCMMILDYSTEDVSETDLYSGFAWQAFTSFSFKIYQNSAVDFVLDLGYRGLSPEKGTTSFDMSGFITRFGVKMFL
jgi:hypothetical protein